MKRNLSNIRNALSESSRLSIIIVEKFTLARVKYTSLLSTENRDIFTTRRFLPTKVPVVNAKNKKNYWFSKLRTAMGDGF